MSPNCAVQADGCRVDTIEGLSDNGELVALQHAFHELNALQCGFCTAGMLITALAFLRRNPSPTREQIREGLSGNYCRCTGYHAIVEAIEKAGFSVGSDIYLGLDVASSEFYHDGVYDLASEGRQFTAAEFTDYLSGLVDQYPIISIEDGMDESDWEGWKLLTEKLGSRIQLVGDDLFVTNPEILAEGIRAGLANALLVKLNQIGTMTETLEAVEMAKTHAYSNVISHRSGETEDTIIADLAVATRAGQIKTGAPCRSDRVAKYNRLLRIEEELEGVAQYPGSAVFPRRST